MLVNSVGGFFLIACCVLGITEKYKCEPVSSGIIDLKSKISGCVILEVVHGKYQVGNRRRAIITVRDICRTLILCQTLCVGLRREKDYGPGSGTPLRECRTQAKI